MIIIQGTNKPITLTFAKAIDFADISVKLSNVNGALKVWKKTDLDIEDNIAQAPLTQQETLAFKEGKAALEVKWLEDGYTEFSEIVPVEILKRTDTTVLVEGE